MHRFWGKATELLRSGELYLALCKRDRKRTTTHDAILWWVPLPGSLVSFPPLNRSNPTWDVGEGTGGHLRHISFAARQAATKTGAAGVSRAARNLGDPRKLEQIALILLGGRVGRFNDLCASALPQGECGAVVCESQPAKWIEELPRLVHPNPSATTLFGMIKVYLDESGIHQGAAICTVAGYAASWENWKQFVPRWNKALKAFGLEESGFHAKRFFARAGKEYRGWKEVDTTECFNHLMNAINAARVVPVGSCLIVELFNRLNADERRYLTGAKFDVVRKKWLTSGAPNTPYHVPIQQAVIDAAKMTPVGSKVHFVHDQQTQYAPLVLERFAELKQILSVRDKLGDMVFSSRQEAVPLQAADLVAFVATKYGEAKILDRSAPPSYEFQRIMERPNNRLRFFDERGLKLILGRCPSQFRTSLVD